VEQLPNVACQKLLKSANAAWSYSKNKSGMPFMDHSVVTSQGRFCSKKMESLSEKQTL